MQVKPFKAFRFDENVVGDAGSCIAPPYDVINPLQQQQLYEKSEYNIVRITKGRTTPSDNENSNQYTRAAGFLDCWIKKGALKQDSTEAIYAYIQDFELFGTTFQRFGFIALAKLEQFGKIVRPHEQILDEPIMDRLEVTRATAAGFGLVFMLYQDKQKIAEKIVSQTITRPSLLDFTDDQGVRHRLFAVTAPEDIEEITNMMSDKSCIIADGHHRYTTALTYAKESANPAAKYQMLAFANTLQKGLTILATHRLVGNLEDFSREKLLANLKSDFQISEFRFDSPQGRKDAKQKMLAEMKAQYENDKNAFGIYAGNNTLYVAVLKNSHIMDSLAPQKSGPWKSLDVSVLHKVVLEALLSINEKKLASQSNVEYIKDTINAIDESIDKIDNKQKQAAFFMNPVKMHQLKAVTDTGERMPQKSTYFYPKMYTGLTINKW